MRFRSAPAELEVLKEDYGPGGMHDLPDLDKPIIRATNGFCCGRGLEVVLDADIQIAAEHATFALPEITGGTYVPAADIALPK